MSDNFFKMNSKINELNGNKYKNLDVELLNPFVHHLELQTLYEKIRTAILTVILLPIRVGIICVLLTIAWILATFGLFGVTEEQLREKPLSGWRRKIVPMLCHIGQWTYAVGGMTIIIKGRQASRKEAPILVAAPHSTFLDGGIIYSTGLPSIIVRRETGDNPYIEKLVNFTQPVYVWRDDPNSRQNTIKEIIDRARSDEDWPQILIFPEGTCTNRSCLIGFKPGAFYPGVPIQPVCIRYPNKFDTVTWTWEGPGALKLLWLTLTQMQSYCEIEFLPVYTPSIDEKNDPKLFANNVRALMAKALGVPVSDYSYEDCKIITRAKQMNLPGSVTLVDALKLRHKLKLDVTEIEQHILDASSILCKDCSQVTFPEFAALLQIPLSETSSLQLFKLYDKTGTGVIDFREYLYTILAISKAEKLRDLIELAFKVFSANGNGTITKATYIEIMKQTLHLSEHDSMETFDEISKCLDTKINFDQFFRYAEERNEFSELFDPNSHFDARSIESHTQVKKVD